MRLIDADNLKDLEEMEYIYFKSPAAVPFYEAHKVWETIDNAPTIDAVPVVQYNDLRDDFIDYVCSGVPNPAPYCGNATEKCVDARGWCVNSECKGFTPRVEGKE